MLSTNLAEQVTAIDVSLTIDGAHQWQVTFLTTASTYTIGSAINIYRDGTLLLKGTVEQYSYDATTHMMTISGRDTNSFTDSYDRQEKTLSSEALTTVSAAINSVKTGAALSCPSIQCFGYGSYAGSTRSFVERVANAFGLNYISNPVGSGYTLSSGNISTPANPTALLGNALSTGNAYSDRISTIYVQKAITQSSATRVTIKNSGSAGSSQTVRLTNPNAVLASESDKQFPIDYFIDPWTKTFITLDVPVAGATVFNQAASIGNIVKLTAVACSDGTAQPPWRLELWNADPGTGATTTATRLARLAPGQTWTAQGSEVATHARISKEIQNPTGVVPITDYPHYDGVSFTAYSWTAMPSTTVDAWSNSYSSGDTGHPDYNVISDEMYPNKALFESQSLGTQIAGRDSVTASKSFSTPGTPALTLKSGYSLTVDGTANVLPATGIRYTNTAGSESATLTGEW